MKVRSFVKKTLVALSLLGAISWLVYFIYPPPGSGGITGKYWSIDDTGLPDRIARSGTFLVVPGVTVADIWPKETADLPGPSYNYFSADYDFRQLREAYGATLAEVQFNGRFRIHAPAGPVVVCRVDPSNYGCREFDLPQHGSLRATSGEGGFWIGVK